MRQRFPATTLLLLGALAGPLFATGCASAPATPAAAQSWAAQHYEAKRTTDAFTHTTTTDLPLQAATEFKAIHCAGIQAVPAIGLSLRQVQHPDSSTLTFLAVNFYASDWLFINDQRPAQLLVRDSVLELPSLGVRHDVNRGSVSEVAGYVVTRAQLQRIASADSVLLRITGLQGRCDVRWLPATIALARLFAQREMQP